MYNQPDLQYLRHSLASLDKSMSSTDMHNTSAASTSRHFLEAGLPSPTSNEAGPSGRQSRSATLPARIRYSDASSSRLSSLEPELESPRTSKSGIQDPGSPVPPSPRDSLTAAGYSAQQGRISGPSSPRESITDGQFLPAGQERRKSIPSSPRSSSVAPPVAGAGQQYQDSLTRSTQGSYYSAAKPTTQQTNIQQPRYSQEPDDSVYQNEYFHNSHLHQKLPQRQNEHFMQQQMYLQHSQQNAQVSMVHQNTINQYQNGMPPHQTPMTQNQNQNHMAQHLNPMVKHQNPMAQHQNPMAQHQNPMVQHQNIMPPRHQNNVNQHQNLMAQHQKQTGQHQIHIQQQHHQQQQQHHQHQQQQQHQSLLQRQPERQTAEGQHKCKKMSATHQPGFFHFIRILNA